MPLSWHEVGYHPWRGTKLPAEILPLDLTLPATFTLHSTTEVRTLRERLRISEVARLVGVTTKTVRHYE
jgi:DNA-binding transcriptional regulator YiaG